MVFIDRAEVFDIGQFLRLQNCNSAVVSEQFTVLMLRCFHCTIRWTAASVKPAVQVFARYEKHAYASSY